MNVFDSNAFMLFKDWTLALVFLALTLVLPPATAAILRRVSPKGYRVMLHQLAIPASNLLYPIGLRLFTEAAPIHPRVESWINNFSYVLFALILLYLARRALLIVIEWGAARTSPTQSLTLQQGFIPLMRNIVTLFILTTGTIMVLKHFNYDVMSLITALGVGSLAVGLAAKDTLANMFAGFTLIIDRNVRPGDRINLTGSIGEIEEIGLRSTRIKTGDGNTLIVPNADLVNNRILNLSVPSLEAIASTRLRIPCAVPFAQVRDLCLAALDTVPLVYRERGRWVQLSSLNDGHQLVAVGFWVRNMDDSGGALSEFHEKILESLRRENIPLLGDPASVNRSEPRPQ